MKTRLFNFLLLSSLLLSACRSVPTPAPPDTPSPVVAADQAAAPVTVSAPELPPATPVQPSSTPTELPPTLTVTPEPSATPSPTPSATPDPSPTPTPAQPRGTLTLVQTLGLGNGRRFSNYELQLTPDEQRLIVTTSAGIHILSAADLSLLRTIAAPADYDIFDPYGSVFRRRIRIARDGSLAAVIAVQADWQKAIKLWDLTNGELLREYPLPPGEEGYGMDVAGLALSPDNTRLVVISEEGLILVLDVASGDIIETIDRYMYNMEQVRWLEYDPSGKIVYLIYQDVGITGIHSYGLDSRTWKESSEALVNIDHFGSDVAAFAPGLSGSGYYWGFFASSGSTRVNAWVYTNFGKRFSIDLPARLSAMAFTPDSQWLVLGEIEPPSLELWAAESTKGPIETFQVDRPLWAVAGTSGGDKLYGVSEDGNLYLWQRGQPEPVHTLGGFYPAPSRLAYTPDGLGLQLYIRNNQEIFSVALPDGRALGTSPNPEIPVSKTDRIPISTSISPDRSTLAVLYYDQKQFELYDLASGKLLRKVPARFTLDQIAFTADGQGMIVFGLNQPLQVLDIRDGKVLAEHDVIESLGGRVYSMLLSGDRSTLVLMSDIGVIGIYDPSTLELMRTIDPGDLEPFQTAISNDGSLLACLLFDNQLVLLDVREGTWLPQTPLNGSEYFLFETLLAFSPDNQELAVAFPYGLVQMYSIAP